MPPNTPEAPVSKQDRAPKGAEAAAPTSERQAKVMIDYDKPSQPGLVAPEDQPEHEQARETARRTMEGAKRSGEAARNMDPEAVVRSATRRQLNLPDQPADSKGGEKTSRSPKGKVTASGAKVKEGGVSLEQRGSETRVHVTPEEGPLTVGLRRKPGSAGKAERDVAVVETGGGGTVVRMLVEPEGAVVEADYKLPKGFARVKMGPDGKGKVTLFMSGVEIARSFNLVPNPGETLDPNLQMAGYVASIPGLGPDARLRVAGGVDKDGNMGPVTLELAGTF